MDKQNLNRAMRIELVVDMLNTELEKDGLLLLIMSTFAVSRRTAIEYLNTARYQNEN